MKLYRVVLPAISLLFSVTCFAQQQQLQVWVKAAARTDSAIVATVQVYSLPDSSLLQTKVSGAKGCSFTLAPGRHYLVTVSAIGYEKQVKQLPPVGKNTSINFFLKKEIASLQEVVVKSKKPLITQEEDKTVVDATNLANSSTSAYEVVEKTPGAIVDQDGNIYLSSSTPATVYINGREMKMSPDDIASLLKSLPAGSISKIEILRTPSAKYDATNSGGIVNIVLKKGIKIGTTGSVNIRRDQGRYPGTSLGANINKSVGNFSTYLSYQFTRRRSFEEVESRRYINGDTLLAQGSNTRYAPYTQYAGGGAEWSVTKKWNLSYDTRLSYNHNSSDAVSNNDFSTVAGGQLYAQSETPISNRGHSIFWGNSLSSRYKIDSLGSEWSAEINYSYSNNNNRQDYNNNYYLPVVPSEHGYGDLSNKANNADIKTDLLWKLKNNFKLEAGAKFSYSGNNNTAAFYTQKGTAAPQVNNYQTNTFRYTEKITSSYLQLSKLLGGFTLKGGLRLENTAISGHQLVPADTSFGINRTDLFPYVYIKHNLFKIFQYPLTANAIFRKSISRPGYDALNPSPKFVDQFLYDAGNPGLQPQFTTNYELNVSFEDFPVLAVGINQTSNIFSRVTYQNEVTKVAYRTWDNLGKNKEIYFRLFGATPQEGAFFFMYAGLQYNYLDYNGIYQNAPLHYTRGSWTFFGGQEYRFSKTFRANLNGWLYVHGFRAFNELKNMGQLNMSFTKTLLRNKLTLVLSGNDILYTNKSSFRIQQAGVLGRGLRVQDSQRFGITLRYNFGVKPREEKKQQYNQEADPKEN